ncbi:MAG TPA: lipid II flippase MurJ [Candidatus Paceibacterota bacterium]
MRKFLQRIAKPVRGLHQAAYWLALLTFASQVLALVRDRTFAHVFGASAPLDLYYAAFEIPDLVFTLVASLVSAYVLIPRIASDSEEEARTLISHASSFLLIFGGAIAAVLAFIAPSVLFRIFPTFAVSQYADAFVLLVRLLLLQPILLGLSGIFASVTQVHRRFVLYALSPVLYNLGIIFGAVALYPRFGLVGIGYGVLLGAFAYLIIHVPIVAGARLMPRLVWPSWRIVGPIMRDSVPRTLALGVGSAVGFAITILAARAGHGIISVFTFATNLEAVPLALIGSSYAVAAFPVLAELSGKGEKEEFTKVLSAAARHLVLWSIIAFGLAIVLRAHLVRVVLGTGRFNWDDTRLTAATFAILIIALAAQGLILLLSRALYAAKQSWRPLIYQLIGGAVSVVVAAAGLYYLHRATDTLSLFGTIFRVGDVTGNIVLVFAVAVVLGQLVTAGFLLLAMRSVAPGFNRSLARPFAEGVIATFLGSVAAYATLSVMGNIEPLTSLVAVLTHGFVAGIVGLVVVASALALFGNEEFRDMRAALHRFAKARILPAFGAS